MAAVAGGGFTPGCAVLCLQSSGGKAKKAQPRAAQLMEFSTEAAVADESTEVQVLPPPLPLPPFRQALNPGCASYMYVISTMYAYGYGPFAHVPHVYVCV